LKAATNVLFVLSFAGLIWTAGAGVVQFNSGFRCCRAGWLGLAAGERNLLWCCVSSVRGS